MTYLKDLHSKSFFEIFLKGDIVQHEGSFYKVVEVYLDGDFKDLYYDLESVCGHKVSILTNHTTLSQVSEEQKNILNLLYI